MKPTRIPLFPLNVVLLPGMALPLHIFEPRYKAMIARCISESIEFGLVLVLENNLAQVGCTAEIVQKLKEYPDGRMDIMTEGRSVFELNELIQEKEYYEASVRYLADNPEPAVSGKEAALMQAFRQVHSILTGQDWDAARSDPEIPLAYRMGARLPLELAERQQLLQMRSESDRQEFLLNWMTEFLPRLRHRQRVRERARGNGHGLN